MLFLRNIFRHDKERKHILASSVASPKPGNLMTPVRIQVLFFRKGITPSWMHSWLEIYTYLRKAIPFPHLFFPDFFWKENHQKLWTFLLVNLGVGDSTDAWHFLHSRSACGSLARIQIRIGSQQF